MLILTRRKREKIIIDDKIQITILDIGRGTIRFGIEAPREIPIRSERNDAASEEEQPPAVPGGESNGL